jgi:hypothetical protein
VDDHRSAGDNVAPYGGDASDSTGLRGTRDDGSQRGLGAAAAASDSEVATRSPIICCKGPVSWGDRPASSVELRGFEPLASSLRTRGW